MQHAIHQIEYIWASSLLPPPFSEPLSYQTAREGKACYCERSQRLRGETRSSVVIAENVSDCALQHLVRAKG
jgi:hypothetical protein